MEESILRMAVTTKKEVMQAYFPGLVEAELNGGSLY